MYKATRISGSEVSPVEDGDGSGPPSVFAEDEEWIDVSKEADEAGWVVLDL